MNLYFRGSKIIKGHLNYINNKYNFTASKKVILTGMSAGGVAVGLWTNYVKDFVGDPDKVYPIADSGVFMNFQTMHGQDRIMSMMNNIYTVANIDESTPASDCNKYF